MNKPPPRALIVMGVSGCGKSSIAHALAEHYGYTFYDADDFHSEENKAHMRAGKALSDDMRLPWIHTMRDFLQSQFTHGQPLTLAYSGLRKAHRDILRQTDMPTRYIFLDGSKALIGERMAARKNHYMPVSLLDSQFSALEDPRLESDVMTVDISGSIDHILDEIKSKL